MLLSRSLTALVLLVLVSLTPETGAQPMRLGVHGGGLGQTLTLSLSGPPGQRYLLLPSFVFAPTPFPGHPVGSLDIGLELLTISLGLPGFFSNLDGAGEMVLPVPVDNNPALDGLNLNFQLLRVVGNKVHEKSNPWRVTFDTVGEYAPTLGGLLQARAFATATGLDDGTVLVAGGGTGTLTSATGLDSVELYRQNLEAFESLSPMTQPRSLHRATRLLDGRVLMVGGVDAFGQPHNSAEVYDPATGASTSTGNLSIARVGHTASLLPDGRVLIAGGSSDLSSDTSFATSAEDSTEIYDPATNSFAPGPSMSQPKTFHDAVTLSNGSVLLTGGITYITIFIRIPDLSDRAQVYTPSGGAGSFGSNLSMGSKRAGHTSILLEDGRALTVGGASGSLLSPAIVSSCELYASGTGFSAAGSLSTARAIAGLVRLPDGRVLASGGAQGDLLNPSSIASCELFTPAPPSGPGSWSAAGAMGTSRSGHGVLLLSDGSVGLIAGGGGPSGAALSSAEIHQP